MAIQQVRCKLALEASGLGTMEQIKNRKEAGLPHPWVCGKYHNHCEGLLKDIEECPEWASCEMVRSFSPGKVTSQTT